MRATGYWRWTQLAACAAAVAGCRQPAEQRTTENTANTVTQTLPLPSVEAPMDRAALLARVAAAASASALRQDDLAAQRELDGRALEVRIRFGCAGEVNPAVTKDFSVEFDEAKRTLRIRAAPTLSRQDPAVAAIAGEAVEAVEGFWLPRPWLLTDGCPALPSPSQVTPAEAKAPQQPPLAPVPSPRATQRIGIGHFFSQTDSRTGRRDDRAYEAVSVLSANQPPSAAGYNLVLSGRLRQALGGRVIVCRANNADAPPDCVVSADIDHVWVENPGTGDVLANWGG